MEHVPSDADNIIKQTAQRTSDASTILQGHYSTLVAKIEEVRNIHATILKEKDITHAQCSRAIASLSNVDEPVKDFHILLQNQPSILLPSIVTEKRHRLLVILNNIENRISEFQVLTIKEINAQREGILERLKSIEDGLKEIVALLERVLGQQPEQQNNQQVLPSTTRAEAQSPTQQASSLVSKLTQGVSALAQKLFRLPLKNQVQQLRIPAPRTMQNMPASPTTGDFEKLYNILQEVNELTLMEISSSSNIEYNRLPGNSLAAKAFELTKELERKRELDKLEKELRSRYPNRFEPGEERTGHDSH